MINIIEQSETSQNKITIKGSVSFEEKGLGSNIFNIWACISLAIIVWRSAVYGEDYTSFMSKTILIYILFGVILFPIFLRRSIEYDQDTNEIIVSRAGNMSAIDTIDLSKITFAKCYKTKLLYAFLPARYYIVFKINDEKNFFRQSFSIRSNIDEVISFLNGALAKVGKSDMSLSIPDKITPAKDFRVEVEGNK